MYFSWFQQNAWIASWMALFSLFFTEGAIIYLLLHYLRNFLGELDRDELKRLAKKLKEIAEPTAADRTKDRVME